MSVDSFVTPEYLVEAKEMDHPLSPAYPLFGRGSRSLSREAQTSLPLATFHVYKTLRMPSAWQLFQQNIEVFPGQLEM